MLSNGGKGRERSESKPIAGEEEEIERPEESITTPSGKSVRASY
jgi:hypothetical protein